MPRKSDKAKESARMSGASHAPDPARSSGQKYADMSDARDNTRPLEQAPSMPVAQGSVPKAWVWCSKGLGIAWAWLKERASNAANGAVEDALKLLFVLVFLLAVGWLGLSWIFSDPPLPPAYDEQATTNPDGPYHFMPMVDYSRNVLGMEVSWDPPLPPDSTALLYPVALSVQKIRGNVLERFYSKYPHCIKMEWSEVKAADGQMKLRDVVTLRLADVDGPEKRDGDPRNFFYCRFKEDVADQKPATAQTAEEPVEPTRTNGSPEPKR